MSSDPKNHLECSDLGLKSLVVRIGKAGIPEFWAPILPSRVAARGEHLLYLARPHNMVVGDVSARGGCRFQEEWVIMCSVFDVAAYILTKPRILPHMKLQKLVYYSQTWSLVWDEKPLFSARIEAWANGPVVKTLYAPLRKQFSVPAATVNGDPTKLNQTQRNTVDSVLRFYGSKSSQWLSDLSHMEDPWKDARTGLSPGERGTEEITRAAIAEYYGSL